MGIVANFLPQICLGLVWGYAYWKTDNLWTAWFAHTLTNTTLNLLHVATLDSMDPGMSIRMTAFSMVSLLMMFLIRYLSRRWKMPEMTAWQNPPQTAVRPGQRPAGSAALHTRH